MYLDSSVPRDGQADVDCYPLEFGARAWIEGMQAEGKHTVPPFVEEQPFSITNEEDIGWVNAKFTAHPIKAFLDPLQLKHGDPHLNARTFILRTMADTAWTSFARARTEPGWRVIELATGHDAMVIAPQAFVDVLLVLAKEMRDQKEACS